jgi:mycofactocin system glycosyltransferase
MIPFAYRLREEVHIEREEGSSVVVMETPLSIIRVSHRATRILQLCDGHRTPAEIALQIDHTEETEVYRICDFLNKRGVLEVGPVRGEGPTRFVTVIIPTKDRRNELAECLESVFSQEYPGDLVEVVVVDDGSTDGTDKLLNDLPCKVLSNSRTRGQSHCRNKGAEVAQGEILAFLDSDCVASPTWLKELVPSFQWNEVGAVGGYVDGYFEESSLDRYEKASSPLNMGARILSAANDASTLYTPTCNLLVRKEVYKEVSGSREEMSVGEDVDLCWRIRAGGHRLLYVPYGAVKHKHRSMLQNMLRRRAQYGTSEALLYSLHRKRKTLQAPPLAAFAFLALVAAVVCLSVIPVFLAAACFLADSTTKVRKIGRMGVPVRPQRILYSVVRTHFSFFYFASFHVVRYYTIALLLLGLLFHPLWLLCLSLLLTTSIVDYRLKKPRLPFAVFFFYYVLEQVAYQAGVFAGCLRQRTFSSYGVKLVRRLP